ncbi:hypothetical protein E2C01_084004 [Portunus trituberculatus]|uniref:Uncharacterized protein n=1 Tax=Portunus trituberculatus TaxID=210409 RepID=A0A5B7J9I8_PORTR|nr:hypothetical protein [Portunus trituberculatus]
MAASFSQVHVVIARTNTQARRQCICGAPRDDWNPLSSSPVVGAEGTAASGMGRVSLLVLLRGCFRIDRR